MKALSRRLFLGAAASIPPTLAAASALPLAAPVSLFENEDLLAIGEQIGPLLGAFRVAARQKLEARATAEKLSPPLPDDLVRKPEDRFTFAGCTARETDVEGNEIRLPNYLGNDGKIYARPDRQIFKAEFLKEAVENGNIPAAPRSKIGKRVRGLIAIAEKYEAGRKASIESSGMEAAADNLRFAAQDIQSLAYRAREIEPATDAGVVILARLLAAYSEAELVVGSGFEGRAGSVLGSGLANSFLRIARPAEVAT